MTHDGLILNDHSDRLRHISSERNIPLRREAIEILKNPLRLYVGEKPKTVLTNRVSNLCSYLISIVVEISSFCGISFSISLFFPSINSLNLFPWNSVFCLNISIYSIIWITFLSILQHLKNISCSFPVKFSKIVFIC